jgi:hypothetical protein
MCKSEGHEKSAKIIPTVMVMAMSRDSRTTGDKDDEKDIGDHHRKITPTSIPSDSFAVWLAFFNHSQSEEAILGEKGTATRKEVTSGHSPVMWMAHSGGKQFS